MKFNNLNNLYFCLETLWNSFSFKQCPTFIYQQKLVQYRNSHRNSFPLLPHVKLTFSFHKFGPWGCNNEPLKIKRFSSLDNILNSHTVCQFLQKFVHLNHFQSLRWPRNSKSLLLTGVVEYFYIINSLEKTSRDLLFSIHPSVRFIHFLLKFMAKEIHSLLLTEITEFPIFLNYHYFFFHFLDGWIIIIIVNIIEWWKKKVFICRWIFIWFVVFRIYLGIPRGVRDVHKLHKGIAFRGEPRLHVPSSTVSNSFWNAQSSIRLYVWLDDAEAKDAAEWSNDTANFTDHRTTRYK